MKYTKKLPVVEIYRFQDNKFDKNNFPLFSRCESHWSNPVYYIEEKRIKGEELITREHRIKKDDDYYIVIDGKEKYVISNYELKDYEPYPSSLQDKIKASYILRWLFNIKK